MKFNANNHRRRQREGGPSISLFPFLAVLICTMGALVPLLFAISRQARLQASQIAASKLEERKVELEGQRETIKWRTEQLKTSRSKTQEQVAEARLELGHLEDHARRLRDKLPALEKTVAELDKLGNEDKRQRSEQFEELQKIRDKIEELKKQVSQAQLDSETRSKSFAVIPFDGPNQTHRRPIYLECTADAVTLQPEGVVFVESDFEGPLGPGNPLASVLRAVREYLMTKGKFDPQRDGEPYPLLLVRPKGIAAYYAAREAMKSWATEFGYEFIDADWKIAYQHPDAQLSLLIKEELIAARARQQRLIAAAPAAYSKKSRPAYRASPGHGGSVRESGSGIDDEAGGEDAGFIARPTSGRGGHRYAGSSSSDSGRGEEESSGMTEAQQLASIYGNTGTATGSSTGTYGQGGYAPGGNMPGGNTPGGYATGRYTPGGYATGGSMSGGLASGGSGGTSGNGYGPALGGGGSAGTPGDAGGTGGSPAAGARNGTAGTGNVPGYAGGTYGGGANAPNTGSGTGYPSTAGAGQGTANGTAPNNGVGGYGGNGEMNAGSNNTGGNIVAGTPQSGIARAGQSGMVGGNGSPVKTDAIYSANGKQLEAGQSSGGTPMKVPDDYIAGKPPSEKEHEEYKPKQTPAKRPIDSDEGMVASSVGPLRPGEWRDPIKPPPPQKPIEEKLDGKKNEKHKKSVASTKGRDWGLPDASGGSVPVTRPIKVECRANELVILPESNKSSGRTIPLGTYADASTQSFISAVWEHMDDWGIAGRGMYWRPILNVYVTPGAEERFTELQAMLEGSGLKVVRK